MFKVPRNKSIQEMESDVLSFWKKDKTFEKSVSNRSDKDSYVFYDGPPFISGLPHYGHLLGSIAKDLIPRYQTMKGKRVERVWGWDAHGLTVENRVQKKLGIKDRKDIEKFGLEKFVQECYAYASETSAEWNWYIDKIGRWVDLENAYMTIDQAYMESVMWVFKQLFDKGLIYEGVRTSLFCTTCGTPVSNFEVAMDNSYKEVEDPSIIVKFKIQNSKEKSLEGKYILAWTTTPWTVPSNRGLVVDEKEDYVLVNNEYIVAKKRLEHVFEEFNVTNEFKGKKLVGLGYVPPYDFYEKNDKDFKVYAFEGMVSMEDGTGIVHSAPGFGEVDTEMGRHYGLTMMLSLDDEGKFIEGDFAGQYYAKANKYIREDLTTRDLLFSDERIVHRLPYHDRCNTLLIQKAQNSWFIDVQKIKKDLLENNKDINWVPKHLKEGRFQQGIEQAPDWCISRSRFWATPMPVWRTKDGDTIVIGSKEELEKLSGQEVKDLHRPYIDEITIEKDGREFKRIPDVVDSWFEAGSMPYGQIHYPFENQEKFDKNFPGDYIVEYIAQVRAWFYVMHVLSTALFNKASFKNVITTGVIAGNDGRKMSKTYQNYTDPKEVLETIGGDALRLFLMNSPLMFGGNANFDEVELRNKVKSVLNPLWNSTKFFLIYATEHNFQPEEPKSDDPMDKWILSRLHSTIKTVDENLGDYIVPEAVKSVELFVDDLSRWYVRRSRTRIATADQNATNTLYHVLTNFAKVASPVIPFITESMYQALVPGTESVHLCDYPEYENKFIDKKIEEKMEEDRKVVSEILSARDEAKIPIRQPLAFAVVPQVHFEEIVKAETNVKELRAGSEFSLDTNITEDLRIEGEYRNMTRKFQSLRKKAGLNVSDKIKAHYEDSEDNQKVIEEFGNELKEAIGATDLSVSDSYKIEKV